MVDPTALAGQPTVEQLYRRLYGEIHEGRGDSAEARALLAQLGAPALAFRGFGRARRQEWSGARADFVAALAAEPAPLLTWLCGAGLFVTRDYDRAFATLERAAEQAPPGDRLGVAARARKLELELARKLGWSQEARELGEALARRRSDRADLRAHTLELRRQAAIRQRAQQAVEGPIDVAARRSYMLLQRDGPAAARAALDTLARRGAVAPEVPAAQLRLELSLGRVDAAAELADAMSPELAAACPAELAALALARGELERARELSQTDADDPRLLYLCGLATYLAGAGDVEAGDLLERARVLRPTSIPIRLALALARNRGSQQRDENVLVRRFTELLDDAPALLSDAAAELELELWTDLGPVVEPARIVAILERALALLDPAHDLELPGYRRASADGRARLRHLVAPIAGGEAQLARLHADNLEFIDAHHSILVKAIGVRPDAPARATSPQKPPAVVTHDPRVWSPRTLDAKQIEQFVRDGYFVIRGGLDPAIADRWRADAIVRLREDPARWVRNYDPADPARSLHDFSPDDPRTWTWSRVYLDGPPTPPLEEFAPRIWGTLCDLLGGPGRIATRVWAENFIIALRQIPELCTNPPSRYPPSRRHTHWHIDDAGPATRLDQIRNGLVGFVLFNELLPRSGNTWIAPDSIGLVARELAGHPEGVDLLNANKARIMTRCEDLLEITGDTGDVFLTHPLLMHMGMSNESDRVRWLSNPMVYLHEPLDPNRPDSQLSPVELVIRRALDAPDRAGSGP